NETTSKMKNALSSSEKEKPDRTKTIGNTVVANRFVNENGTDSKEEVVTTPKAQDVKQHATVTPTKSLNMEKSEVLINDTAIKKATKEKKSKGEEEEEEEDITESGNRNESENKEHRKLCEKLELTKMTDTTDCNGPMLLVGSPSSPMIPVLVHMTSSSTSLSTKPYTDANAGTTTLLIEEEGEDEEEEEEEEEGKEGEEGNNDGSDDEKERATRNNKINSEKKKQKNNKNSDLPNGSKKQKGTTNNQTKAKIMHKNSGCGPPALHSITINRERSRNPPISPAASQFAKPKFINER
ncbi:hypothetical protein RFI_13851, partial [Reticulomyxa filosa]